MILRRPRLALRSLAMLLADFLLAVFFLELLLTLAFFVAMILFR